MAVDTFPDTATDPTAETIAKTMAFFAGMPDHADLIRVFTSRYGQPMLGGTRAVFDLQDGTVAKVAVSDEGMMANAREAAHTDSFIPLAPCRIDWDPDLEVSYLIMDRVDPVYTIAYKDLPPWASWVDCAQVGRLPDGTLVAYDL